MAILNKATLTSKFSNTSGEEISVTNTSNTSLTNNLTTDLTLIKTASQTWALPTYTITVTTTITNDTDLSIDTFYYKDNLTAGASFVVGSLKIGTLTYADFDPIAGFTAPVTLDGSGASATISYDIKIVDYPETNAIKNSTAITVNLESRDFTLASNEINIDILDNEIWLNKSASKVAISGDELTYSIVISNSGSFTNSDLFFTDPTPSGTTFVAGSVTVNGVSQPTYDPNTGFGLGNLAPNDEITVTFKVKIE